MNNPINEARLALLAIWPSGTACNHGCARSAFHALDAAEERDKHLVEALSAMCHQYLRVDDGKLHHDFMSAGEAAFDALGWPDDGQPLDASCLCEVPGCGRGWTSGDNGKDGKYHTLCSTHYGEWLASGGKESPEQAEERWTDNLRRSGMSDAEIAAHKTKLKEAHDGWLKMRERMSGTLVTVPHTEMGNETAPSSAAQEFAP